MHNRAGDGQAAPQTLDVIPQNLGDSGGAILTINGGATYCTLFGGVAGGTDVLNAEPCWFVKNAIAQGCPAPQASG